MKTVWCVLVAFGAAVAYAEPVEPPPSVSSPRGPNDLIILLHADSPLQALDVATLASMYLGRTTHWEGGRRVSLLMRSRNQLAGRVFLKNVLQMVPARFQHHWNKLELSGQGIAPDVLSRASDVANVVSARKGAIGYIVRSELPEITAWRVNKIELSR